MQSWNLSFDFGRGEHPIDKQLFTNSNITASAHYSDDKNEISMNDEGLENIILITI